MEKVFYIKGFAPYQLLAMSKDEFYDVADDQFRKQFNKDITIECMELDFVSTDKIRVEITEYSIKALKTVEQVWDYLVELGIAKDEELKLITQINGYSIESLEDVIYARTGFNNIEQLVEDY